MSWICEHCKNDVDDEFDICWSCGASFDGIENPDFCQEIEATDLPTDGTRVIRCEKCGYRGESKQVQAVGRFFTGFYAMFFGILGLGNLSNHACPVCGETRQIYDWKR